MNRAQKILEAYKDMIHAEEHLNMTIDECYPPGTEIAFEKGCYQHRATINRIIDWKRIVVTNTKTGKTRYLDIRDFVEYQEACDMRDMAEDAENDG